MSVALPSLKTYCVRLIFSSSKFSRLSFTTCINERWKGFKLRSFPLVYRDLIALTLRPFNIIFFFAINILFIFTEVLQKSHSSFRYRKSNCMSLVSTYINYITNIVIGPKWNCKLDYMWNKWNIKAVWLRPQEMRSVTCRLWSGF